MPITRRTRVRVTPPRPRRLASMIAAGVAILLAVTVGAAPATADYTAGNLPDWAIGPFTRAPQNPLLTPPGSGWDADEVYNPGVIYRDGTFQMLYRGEHDGVSQVGYASSGNGTAFTPYAGNPVIPDSLPNETSGIEDPRLYQLDGVYYSFFTAVHGGQIDINEATSTNMTTWTQLGPVVTGDKDAAVVTDPTDAPIKINGRYVMYYGQHGEGTYIAYSTDMIHWTGNTPLDMDFPANYAPWELCVAVTDYQTVQGGPIRTGIDLFVAGTLMAGGRWYYAISEVEFAGSDLTRQLAQLTEPVLSPSQPYELTGLTNNTIWMNSIMFVNGQWYMYYSGADTVVTLATAPLRGAGRSPFASTDFQTDQRQPDWADSVDNGGGSSGGLNNVNGFPGYGLTGPETSVRRGLSVDGVTDALMYSGNAEGGSTDYAYTKVFDTSDAPPAIDTHTTLSYWIYPQSSATQPGVSGDLSTCAGLDAIFSDGTALRNARIHDTDGIPLHPADMCGHLVTDQWNYVSTNIGSAEAGKTLQRIDVGFDDPNGSGAYRGYITDISLTG